MVVQELLPRFQAQALPTLVVEVVELLGAEQQVQVALVAEQTDQLAMLFHQMRQSIQAVVVEVEVGFHLQALPEAEVTAALASSLSNTQ
jgi:hypothetical protein